MSPAVLPERPSIPPRQPFVFGAKSLSWFVSSHHTTGLCASFGACPAHGWRIGCVFVLALGQEKRHCVTPRFFSVVFVSLDLAATYREISEHQPTGKTWAAYRVLLPRARPSHATLDQRNPRNAQPRRLGWTNLAMSVAPPLVAGGFPSLPNASLLSSEASGRSFQPCVRVLRFS